MSGFFDNSSDEGKAILKRGQLVPSSLLHLIGPDYIRYADIEQATFYIPKKKQPPPFWSPDLERLFKAVEANEWFTLTSDRTAMIEKVSELRREDRKKFFSPNKSARVRLLREVDEIYEGYLGSSFNDSTQICS